VATLDFVKAMEAERQQRLAKTQQELLEKQRENARFVFIQPRVDMQAPKPPPRADLSDMDRKARTVERAAKPTNSMPFSRGNTFERIEGAPPTPEAKANETPQPQPQPKADERQAMALPNSPTGTEPKGVEQPQPRGPSAGDRGRHPQRAESTRARPPSTCRVARIRTSAGVQFDSKVSNSVPGCGGSSRRFAGTGSSRNPRCSRRGMLITFMSADGRITELKVLTPAVGAFNIRYQRWRPRTTNRCRLNILTTVRSSRSPSISENPGS
jgi:hypothetical protein